MTVFTSIRITSIFVFTAGFSSFPSVSWQNEKGKAAGGFPTRNGPAADCHKLFFQRWSTFVYVIAPIWKK
jgi:hypothetical protein